MRPIQVLHSTVTVHDKAMAPGVQLCEIPTLHREPFCSTDFPTFKKLFKNYCLFVFLSLKSCYLTQGSGRMNPNCTVLSADAFFSYINAYLRLINFKQLSTLIIVIWGFRPQSSNKFSNGLKSPFVRNLRASLYVALRFSFLDMKASHI